MPFTRHPGPLATPGTPHRTTCVQHTCDAPHTLAVAVALLIAALVVPLDVRIHLALFQRRFLRRLELLCVIGAVSVTRGCIAPRITASRNSPSAALTSRALRCLSTTSSLSRTLLYCCMGKL